ncbi:MAG: transglutaminase-like domain-containing protein [Proteobacteria bacterium]|nr:transglutaminase-like domain-containing protein [Pseudomonadota bacterium]
MNRSAMVPEPAWVQSIKIILLAIGACGYTIDLADNATRLVMFVAIVLAGVMASWFVRRGVRLVWTIVLALGALGAGLLGTWMILEGMRGGEVASIVWTSRFVYYGVGCYALALLTRSLALRYGTARILEFLIVVGSVVFVFFAHRDLNLHNPRAFADWAYGRGYDPVNLYRGMGVGVVFLSMVFLLGRVTVRRTVYSFVLLAILALLAVTFGEGGRIPMDQVDPFGLKKDDGEDGKGDKDKDQDKADGDKGDDDKDQNKDKDDESGRGDKDDKDGSSGNKDGDDKDGDKGKDGDNKDSDGEGRSGTGRDGPTANDKPTPVAIAVLFDEYSPGDGIFHFRQNVLSRYNGNNLVASSMDDDVISRFPIHSALVARPVQSPDLHVSISTSMFLLQDHQHPPQLAMGQKVFPIDNPDPKLFVSSYGVESLGFTIDVTRLIGRRSIPADWDDARRAHYLAIPDDPRYLALSNIIVRQIDPRFYGDDIVKALTIKTWLEKEGYYTLKIRHVDPKDPTASFLFGSLRGYCVHFAHAAVYLLRSQGIAARVALGYAVDNRLRGTNSAVLILGNMAHAWPEIFVDGVGWVTLEIFPENGDEPPPPFVDQDLESLFGELARDDKSGGKSAKPIETSRTVPWALIWKTLVGLVAAGLAVLYMRKIVIVVQAVRCRRLAVIHRALRGVIFVWAMYGRRPDGMTLEQFAVHVAGTDSATARVVDKVLCAKLGGNLSEEEARAIGQVAGAAISEAARRTPLWRRVVGWLNPWVM